VAFGAIWALLGNATAQVVGFGAQTAGTSSSVLGVSDGTIRRLLAAM
jgi:hypothetical protein